MSAELWDADPDVCCAAFQTGACVHTEAMTEEDIDYALSLAEEDECSPDEEACEEDAYCTKHRLAFIERITEQANMSTNEEEPF